MNLIDKLEAQRLHLGLTKEKMARLIDIPYGTYMRWVKSPNRPMSELTIRRLENLEFMK